MSRVETWRVLFTRLRNGGIDFMGSSEPASYLRNASLFICLR